MQPVNLRIVRDDGEEFHIDNERWLIPNDGLEGWAELDYGVSTSEYAAYDGGIVTNRRVNVRDRSVTAELADWRENATARAEAIGFFSPAHTYAAHLTYQGRTRWCEGVQYAFKCSAGNVYEPIQIDWTILSPMPYLLSEDDYGKDIALVTPKFGFPYMSAVEGVSGKVQRGFQTGVYVFGDSVEVENDGDVEAWPTIVIKATGTVETPTFGKWNGADYTAHVTVDTTLESGDVLTIDTESHPPVCEVNGESVTNLVDHLSAFTEMSIPLGKSTVRYSATSGENAMSVSLYFRKRYLGI